MGLPEVMSAIRQMPLRGSPELPAVRGPYIDVQFFPEMQLLLYIEPMC